MVVFVVASLLKALRTGIACNINHYFQIIFFGEIP